MNAKLKRYAKLKRSLQLLHLNPEVPFQTTWYGKICSKASQFRVDRYKDVNDTRKLKGRGFSREEIQESLMLKSGLTYDYVHSQKAIYE